MSTNATLEDPIALTLPDPRHEAFAVAIARGFAPAIAYYSAGFSGKNRKARANRLTKNKKIQARIEVLKACHLHTEAMKERFAPSLLLIPETQDQMLAWLWQVMTGDRKILPLQMRAATLFCTVRGWNLRGHAKSPASASAFNSSQTQDHQEHPPAESLAAHLTDLERNYLALQNIATLNTDLRRTVPDDKTTTAFYSAMANLAQVAAAQHPDRAQIFNAPENHQEFSTPPETPRASAPESSPVAPQLAPSPQASANGASSAPLAPCTLLPAAPVPTVSPSQLPDPQALTPLSSPPGDKIKTPSESAPASSPVAPQLVPSLVPSPQTTANNCKPSQTTANGASSAPLAPCFLLPAAVASDASHLLEWSILTTR